MVADYYNDPKLWEQGALQAKSPEDEVNLHFINLLIQFIQKDTGLKAKDAGLLTRQALLSVFLTPILSELEEYLNELYDLRKQLNLFLDLHIYEQGEILTEADIKSRDIGIGIRDSLFKAVHHPSRSDIK